jgi:hypothetical protein
VEGDNFPPATWRLQLAQVLGLAKIVIIVCVVASINFFPFLGFEQAPSWYLWLQNNKLYGCLMIFFVSEFNNQSRFGSFFVVSVHFLWFRFNFWGDQVDLTIEY